MKLALNISNRNIDSQRENHIYRQSECRKGQAKKGKTHISLNTHDRIWLKGARGIKKTGRIQQKPWKGDMLKPGVSTPGKVHIKGVLKGRHRNDVKTHKSRTLGF